jgi:hypothetical protein
MIVILQHAQGEKLVENYIDVFFRGGPGSPVKIANANKSHRQARLKTVFRIFDLDDGGGVGVSELFHLGRARRTLGQKNTDWTWEMAVQMCGNMGGE